jgi:hypothetical protein
MKRENVWSRYLLMFKAMACRVLTVFQFLVVALTFSCFSKKVFERSVLPYPFGQYR